MQISATISGGTASSPVGLTKDGPGILYLSGANTFTGPIQVDLGVLEVSSAVSLGNAANTVTLDGGTLQFVSAFDPSAAGPITLPASSSLDTQGNTVPIAGNISGAGALTKLGSGTLVLEGTNSFNGGLTIDAGTVQANTDAELGATGVPVTLAGGTLVFTSAFTLSRPLIFNSSGGTINASGGGLTLSTAPSWTGNLTLAGGTLTYNVTSGSTSISGNPTLTILPTATLIDGGTVDPLHTSSGASVNIVNNSVTSFDITTGNKTVGFISGIGNTNVSSGSTLTANSIQQNMLFVNGNVTILTGSPHNSSAGVSVVSTLNIAGTTNAWTAQLDLTNNDLIVHSGSLAMLNNQIQQSYASGRWTGTGGITSSAAAANTLHLTTLGIIQNNQNGTPIYGNSTPFDGQYPGSSDILIKYVYYGDTNLDGKVDASDYTRIDSAFLADRSNSAAVTGWFNGDFNYDGLINGSDYTLIDNAFNTQGASLQDQIASSSATANAQTPSAASLSTDYSRLSSNPISISSLASTQAVPEPTSASLIAFGTATLLGRRRRR